MNQAINNPLAKSKRKIPPRYNKNLDGEILQKIAGEYRGSLIGQIASGWLKDLRLQRRIM